MLDATSGRDCDPEAIAYNVTILEDGEVYSKQWPPLSCQQYINFIYVFR